jgi:RNA polymerase sigma-70 factor, ECF subfamily
MDWDRLVRQNTAIVVHAAFRVLGRTVDAEDVAQFVFLEVFEKSLQPTKDWPSLLRCMAVRRAIDTLRSRQPAISLPETGLPDSSTFEPMTALLAAEQETLLRQAVTRLPPRESEVFCLHYFEGLSHADIAQTLNIAPGAVAVSLSKAKSRLAAALCPA